MLLVTLATVFAGMSEEFARGGARAAQGLFVLVWMLYSVMEVVFAATPGKMILGLRIARQNGRDAEVGRRLLRWSTKYYSLVPAIFDCIIPGTLIGVLGSCMNSIILCGLLGAFNDDRLTWHDEWAGTAVWTRRRMPPPLPIPPLPALR